MTKSGIIAAKFFFQILKHGARAAPLWVGEVLVQCSLVVEGLQAAQAHSLWLLILRRRGAFQPHEAWPSSLRQVWLPSLSFPWGKRSDIASHHLMTRFALGQCPSYGPEQPIASAQPFLCSQNAASLACICCRASDKLQGLPCGWTWRADPGRLVASFP